MCSGTTAAIYKLSNISPKNDTIFHESYAKMIDELYAGIVSIPYTKVTSIHYQTLFKKETNWMIDFKNLPASSLQGLPLLFPKKLYDFANKNSKFYNPSIKEVLARINAMSLKFFLSRFTSHRHLPWAKKVLLKRALEHDIFDKKIRTIGW